MDLGQRLAIVTDPVRVARRWQNRLGLQDWPLILKADPHIRIVHISTGAAIDLVVLPTILNETEIVETMLLYAFHNVPDQQRPSRADVWAAACELVTVDWQTS